MSKIISVKKGAINVIEVLVSYGVVATSLWLTKKLGVGIPEEQQATMIILGTSAVTGLFHGLNNWVKHLPKKVKVLPSNPSVDKKSDQPQV